MVRLVDDLLDASRISRGQIELRRETIDLASVVANAVQTARPLIDQAEHRLAISVPSEPLLLEADSVRLAQVVGNLLCNAAKYTPRGGQIWLIGRRVEDGVELLVRDTGAGIDADLLPRIFDMFMQIESSKPHSLGGLGLGLALARKIVELHDGRIEAISPGIGQGSEFHVWLPASLLRRQPSSSAITPATDGPAASARRILVVDDMNDALFILSSLLKKLGHEVETARDAVSAMEAVRRLRPEIVFSDIAMPGVDGYELARRLRQMHESAGVTLVALTGYGQESDRQRAADAGFDHHLVKPVGIGDLRELLSCANRSLSPTPVRDHDGTNDSANAL